MSAQQFLEMLYGNFLNSSRTKRLRALWSSPDTRSQLLRDWPKRDSGKTDAEMQRTLMLRTAIFRRARAVAYALPPLSREERATKAKVESHHLTADSKFLDSYFRTMSGGRVEELDQENLLSAVKVSADFHLCFGGSFLAAERWEGIGHMREHVEKIAVLSINDPLHSAIWSSESLSASPCNS